MILLRRGNMFVVKYRGLVVIGATVPLAMTRMWELVWGDEV